MIGAIFTSQKVHPDVLEILRPEDFYYAKHGAMYAAALELDQENRPVDPITLGARLDQKGTLKRCGGIEKLWAIANIIPASANAPHYAKIISELATHRKLIVSGQKIISLGAEGNGSIDSLLAEAEASFTEATVESTRGPEPQMIGDELEALKARIHEATETGEARYGLRTGFVDLDNATTGLYPGQVVVIAARPGIGKSTLALNISENVADAGGTVLFTSLEMSRAELAIKSLCRASTVQTGKLRRGVLDESEINQVELALKKIKLRRLIVEDNPGVSLQKLRSTARRLQRQDSLDLLVIDYIQLLTDAVEHRQNAIAVLSRTIKLMAKELGVPILALSQLNRKNESREDKRPNLSDLRDSGAIEQDADIVAFIHRQSAYEDLPVELAERRGADPGEKPNG